MFRNFQFRPYSLIIIAITHFYPTIGIILRDESPGYNFQPTSLFNHVIRHQSTIPHQYISLTTPQPLLTADAYFKSNSLPTDIFAYENFAYPTTPYNNIKQQQPQPQFERLSEIEYIVNGRVLKQYLVMEDLDDDNSIDSFLNNHSPTGRQYVGPFLPPNFNAIKPNRPQNLGFPINQNIYQRSFQSQQSPAIALGSGSLGYIRLPNGSIFIGSGSLGYINDQQRASDIQNVRNRQSSPPSPLTFGSSN